jgi:hypothetical protein
MALESELILKAVVYIDEIAVPEVVADIDVVLAVDVLCFHFLLNSLLKLQMINH